jgi:hypothetical protein
MPRVRCEHTVCAPDSAGTVAGLEIHVVYTDYSMSCISVLHDKPPFPGKPMQVSFE